MQDDWDSIGFIWRKGMIFQLKKDYAEFKNEQFFSYLGRQGNERLFESNDKRTLMIRTGDVDGLITYIK